MEDVARRARDAVQYRTGTVVAVLDGGRAVNLDVGGVDIVPAVPALGTAVYAVGDVVNVAVRRSQWQVVGVASRAQSAPADDDLAESWSTSPPSWGGTEVSTVWLDPDGGRIHYQLAAAPPPPAAPNWLEKSSVEADSYRSGWRNIAEARQGDSSAYGSGFGGLNTGVWFFGNVWGGLAGKTPTRVRLTLTRARGGRYGPTSPVLWLHDHASKPGGPPVLLGSAFTGPGISVYDTATFDLPVEWGTALRDGQASGVAAFTQVGSDYMTFTGAATLRVDY